MRKHLRMGLSLLVAVLSTSACSDAMLVAHKRDESFYKGFVNSSSDFRSAPSKLTSLKLLQNESSYPMRMALFENGKLYYQIDELGDGYGVWTYKDGALSVWASRPRFEMKLMISSPSETATLPVIKFYDRHGLNSVDLNFRDPGASRDGESLPPLRTYQYSDVNI